MCYFFILHLCMLYCTCMLHCLNIMILLIAKTCQVINEIFILYFVFCIHTLHVKINKSKQ